MQLLMFYVNTVPILRTLVNGKSLIQLHCLLEDLASFEIASLRKVPSYQHKSQAPYIQFGKKNGQGVLLWTTGKSTCQMQTRAETQGSEVYTYSHTHTSNTDQFGALDVLECSLVSHLYLVLGLELSPQLFHASSVPQDPTYTFSYESSTINFCGFFNAIFPLLLHLDKSQPSTEYLQHQKQTAGTITKTSSGLGTPLPLQTRTLSVPLDSNRQSYCRTNTTKTKE